MKVRILALLALVTLAAAACTSNSPTAPESVQPRQNGSGFMGGY